MTRLKKLFFAAVFCILAIYAPAHASAQETEQQAPPSVSAQSALLMAVDSKTVLYEKDAGKLMPMASTTKIMTALLALEQDTQEIVEVTAEMVAVEGSSMGLRAGDRINILGIVQGMMMSSGNDAANTIAIHIGGSQEEFAQKMNERAREIGMENTNFVTSSGLDDEGHYSTAYDMALLTCEALKNQAFKNICSSEKISVEFMEPVKTCWFGNHNKLLKIYDGCIGVKTGFTKKSGRCLVSAAERDGATLVAVTLNAPDDWNDHSDLLDYGYSIIQGVSFDESDFYYELPVVGGEKSSIALSSIYGGEIALKAEDARELKRQVSLPRFLYAGIEQGQVVGSIDYYRNSKRVYSLPIKAAETVDLYKKTGLLERLFKRE